MESEIEETKKAAIANSSSFCLIFELSTIQNVILPTFIKLFESPEKDVFFKKRILETMFGLTVFEDNEVINTTLGGLFGQCITHSLIEVRITLMMLLKDNIKLVSPIHLLENAYVSQIEEIYDNCSIAQKLEVVAIIKLLILNVEYLFHNHQFLKFLKDKLLSDAAYIIRMSILRVFVETKDFIGLKVFEKRLLGIFMDLGNSSVPDQMQLFCHFVIVCLAD